MKEAEGAADAPQPDPRLVAVVERLFERCYSVRARCIDSHMVLGSFLMRGACPNVAACS